MTQLPKYTYLYGFTKQDVAALSSQPYREAIQAKIDAAKALLARLIPGTYLESDTTRVNDVIKAIKFNQQLLDELS